MDGTRNVLVEMGKDLFRFTPVFPSSRRKRASEKWWRGSVKCSFNTQKVAW